MSRLIDADKLIEEIWEKHKEAEIYAESVEEVKDAYCDVVSIIDDLPTAYDVDKVVEEIKNAKNENGMVIWRNNKPLIEREQVLEIVKAGGIDE